MPIVVSVILILVLVFINAFFAGSEAAIVACNPIIVENDSNKGNKKASLTLRYINDSTMFLSAIQVGITFMGFINGFLAAESFTDPIYKLFNGVVPAFLIKIIITLILTYIQVIFGEIIPKQMAMKKPEKFIYKTIRTIHVFKIISLPLVAVLTKSADGIAKLFRIDDVKEEMTEEELKLLVLGSGSAIREEEKDLFEKILAFDDQVVSDVMTHRTEVAAIDINDSYNKIIKLIKTEQYSRYPVYEESLDNIIGILHVKDLIGSTFTKEKPSIKRYLRKPFYVPEVMKTDDLFKEMQTSKNHIAVVLDEFGGTSGIVTMENILEEIVGNIFDEHDEVTEEVSEISKNTYVIDALASIDYVEDIINANLPTEEYDTLGGFVLGILGRLPKAGELVSFEYNDFLYEVLSYDEKIIELIKVTKLEKDQEEDNSNGNKPINNN